MKKKSNQTKLLLALALVFCLILGGSGKKISETLDRKVQNQTQITQRFERWLASYKVLEPVKQTWNQTFVDGGKVQDLRTLYQLLNLDSSGLLADPVKLQVESHDRVTSPTGIDLGLTKICLYSQARKMTVYANTFSDLLAGVNRLKNRQDLILGEIEIRPGERKPTAEISKFCVLMRDPATKSI